MQRVKPKNVVIALYNMGGPESIQDVERFLLELFQDNDLLDAPFGSWFQKFLAARIVKKRLHEVQDRYNLIGGKSPQMQIARDLCNKLQSIIDDKKFAGDLFNETKFYVLPLFRYCNPNATELFDFCLKNSVQEVWLFSLYPHCSRPTTGSSLKDIARTQFKNKGYKDIVLRNFSNYFDDPLFIDIWYRRVQRAWETLKGNNKHLIVTAHSLPLSYVSDGDPYPHQIVATANEVCKRLGLFEGRDWTLSWQSAVGPMKWLEPDTRVVLKKLKKQKNVDSVLMWPVAFVSDHIETDFEIDIDFFEQAQKAGIKHFTRVPNLNADNDFVNFIFNKIHHATSLFLDKPENPLLRNLHVTPAGPYCHNQQGGCLCSRYFRAGAKGYERGCEKKQKNSFYERIIK